MLTSTQAILLHTLRYSDNSVIAKVYTRSHGIVPFMVHVGKGRRSASKGVLLQPLTLLEIGFEPNSKSGIKRPRSWERSSMLANISCDTIKTTLALFVAEVIMRSIGEEEQNDELFSFLEKSVLNLDSEKNPVQNFHLKFMVEFSRFLGFYPNEQSYKPSYMFNLYEGEFVPQRMVDPHHISVELSEALYRLLKSPPEHHFSIKLSTEMRRDMLAALIQYFKLHLDGMRDIRGHLILQEVLG